ncbi:MAG: exodeoxyribonuclease VII small subunit [Eubacteriales bacterium]
MATKDFAQSMSRLEQIVATLDDGQASLEEALALFEEGAGLIRTCSKTLEKAEVKVKKLTPSADGTPIETEIEGE